MAWKYLAFAFSALMATTTVSVAQQTAVPAPQAVKPEAPVAAGGEKGPFAACKADMATLCKDAPSGLIGRVQCLKSNQDKLSPACVSSIKVLLGSVQAKAASTETMPPALKACAQEVAAICPDIAVEGGRLKCLRENKPKLSSGCAESLKGVQAQAQGSLKACEADRKRLCVSTGAKISEQLKCLKEKSAELDAECWQVVMTPKANKARTVTGPDAVNPGSPAPPVYRSLAPPPAAAPSPASPKN